MVLNDSNPWLFDDNSQAGQEDPNAFGVTKSELYNYNPEHVDDLVWQSVSEDRAERLRAEGKPTVISHAMQVFMSGEQYQ